MFEILFFALFFALHFETFSIFQHILIDLLYYRYNLPPAFCEKKDSFVYYSNSHV